MTDFTTPLIFINYRNNDTAGETGRMVDHLKTVIDPKNFFLDIKNLEKGAIFPPLLKKSIEQCQVFVAVIGPGWLERLNSNMEADAVDYVRIELAIAIKKKKKILPVLVKGASMPLANQLPNDLKGFEKYNATELSYTRWEYDMSVLVAALRNYGIPLITDTKRSNKKLFAVSVAIIAVLLLLIIGFDAFVFKSDDNTRVVPGNTRQIPPLIAGNWRPLGSTNDKVTYKISQTSRQLIVEEYNVGARTYTGYGSVTNNKISLTIMNPEKGNPSYVFELSTDHNKLIGSQNFKMKGTNQNIGIAVTWENIQP